MKLDPRSIPYRAAERLVRFGWPLLFVVVSGASGVPFADSIGPNVLAVLIVCGLFVLVSWQVLVYRRFSYAVTTDTLDIRSGVFSRREREIPLHRIQNVDTSRNVLQRALGIVAVRIETAGGSSTEATLRYLSTEKASALRSDVRRGARTERAEEASDEDRSHPTELFAITPRELALLGVVSIDLRLVSLATIVLPVVGPPVATRMAPDGVPVGPMGALVLAPLSAAAFVLLSGVASGVFRAGNYYGFRLFRAGRDLQYERGLFERSEGVIPEDKIQALAIEETVLARRVGYATLAVETAGYAPGQGPGGGSAAAVPLATRERCLSLARAIEPISIPAFRRPPKRARTRYAIRYVLLTFLLAGLAWGATRLLSIPIPWYAAFVFLLLAPVAAHLKWVHRGYALAEGYVFTRNGFWTRTTTVVPDYRVQTIAASRTIFQRRRSLATLTVDTAGASGSRVARAVDIDAAVADELRETVAADLQRALTARRADRAERATRLARAVDLVHPLATDIASRDRS